MSRQLRTHIALLLIILAAFTGCHPTQPFYFHEDGDLSHYLDQQLQPEFADVYNASLAEVENCRSPYTLSDPFDGEIWDLTLEDCVSIALHNSKVIRDGIAPQIQNGQIFAGGSISRFGADPRTNATVWNPAVVESNPGVTNAAAFSDGGIAGVRQGVEAALSTFDPQFNIFAGGSPGTGPLIQKTDRPRNVPVAGNPFQTQNFQANNSDLEMNITKFNATGGTTILRSTTSYNWNNIPIGAGRAVPSDWTQVFEAEWRQPLLQGRGAQINRMPVIIARIGTDRELLGLESQLQRFMCNVEIRYWDLQLAYRTLETAKIGRDSALALWKILEPQSGVTKNLEEVAQAREQYFFFRAATEQALRDLYDAEVQLRFTMGIAPRDDRLIRPIDEPTMAKVEFDFCEIRAEALVRRPELRDKKWEIQQREMELILARNQLLPQLNARLLYRWVGVGDTLINSDRNGLNFPTPGSTAFDVLTKGDYQEVTAGFDFRFPIGFRNALAGVRHAQLRLVREKALLEELELAVASDLDIAYRNLDTNYALVQTQFNRWVAGSEEVDTLEAKRIGGVLSVDLVLQAQRRRAQAQADYYRAVAEYNKAIADIHCRKGSILDYNNVCFAEGPWPKKAYWDALGRARERDASYYMDYGWSRPRVISQGPVPQGAGDHLFEGAGEELAPTPAEEIPAPLPGDMEMEMNEGGQEESILPAPAPTAAVPKSAEPTLIATQQTAGARRISPTPAKTQQAAGYQWGDLGLSAGGTSGGDSKVELASEKAAPKSKSRNVLRQAGFEEKSLR